MSKPKQLSGPDFIQAYSFAKLRDGEMLREMVDKQVRQFIPRGEDDDGVVIRSVQ